MLKDKVKDELNRMEKMLVIKTVEEPTKWVNPIVIVRKSNGYVRICLDPVDLNKAVEREHYPSKTVEEVAVGLSNAKMFSILDANLRVLSNQTCRRKYMANHIQYNF